MATKAEIARAYRTLAAAKLTRLDDEEKFQIVKIIISLKPIAKEYEDFIQQTKESLKADNHEEMLDKANRWNFTNKGRNINDLTDEEKKELFEINRYFAEYSNKVEKWILEEGDKGVNFAPFKLSNDTATKLIASNDWNCEQAADVFTLLI